MSNRQEKWSPGSDSFWPKGTIIATIGAVSVASVILLLAAITLAAAGHGPRFHLVVLYPWAVAASTPMMLVGGSPATVTLVLVAFAQFPAYAVIAMTVFRKNSRRMLSRLVYVHCALALIILLLARIFV